MQSGVLVRKILQGNAIADLPVECPTRFKLVANLVAARAFGLTMLPLTALVNASSSPDNSGVSLCPAVMADNPAGLAFGETIFLPNAFYRPPAPLRAYKFPEQRP
jgi:hypothetical protein